MSSNLRKSIEIEKELAEAKSIEEVATIGNPVSEKVVQAVADHTNLNKNENSSAATQPEPTASTSKKAQQIQETRQRNEAVTRKLAARPVAKRFAMMASLVDMVMRRIHPSVLICGPGGTGKSYMVKEQLKKRGFAEDKPGRKGYSWIAGHMAPTGIYQAMHSRKDGGVLVLDDVDIWNGANASTGMELCKAALDSYEKRVISWQSNWAEQNGLPRKFEFNGQVIFITNKLERQIPQPLLDRCFYIPVVLTSDEIFERMEQIVPNMYPKVPLDKKLEVLNYLKESYKGGPVSFRTLDRGIRLRVGCEENEWKDFLDVFAV